MHTLYVCELLMLRLYGDSKNREIKNHAKILQFCSSNKLARDTCSFLRCCKNTNSFKE